eukprot:g6816.t1
MVRTGFTLTVLAVPGLAVMLCALLLGSFGEFDWAEERTSWRERVPMDDPPTRVGVLGASGTIGHELLRNLVKAATDTQNPVSKIVLIVRSKSALKECREWPPHMKAPPSYERYECVEVDFERLARGDDAAQAAVRDALRGAGVLFSCFGTSERWAADVGALRRVDVRYTAAVAAQARAAGVPHLSAVTASGAHLGASARLDFLRAKAETEAALRALVFPRLSLFRPALVIGGSSNARPRGGGAAEALALAALEWAPSLRDSGWVPPALRPLTAYALAQSMLTSAGWALAAGAGAGASEAAAGVVEVFNNSVIHDIANEFFVDFGRTKKWSTATSACGWGCAGAIDDHDNGQAQAELSRLSRSAREAQGPDAAAGAF